MREARRFERHWQSFLGKCLQPWSMGLRLRAKARRALLDLVKLRSYSFLKKGYSKKPKIQIHEGMRPKNRRALPYAGMSRIRFDGFFSVHQQGERPERQSNSIDAVESENLIR
jgi:hypothetical protein